MQKKEHYSNIARFCGKSAAGLAICIEGFSTFSCQPLLNIHDLAVAHAFQGRGIGRKLVEHVANLAKELGCCKVTLEVLDGNTRASDLYKSCGFANYALSPEMGTAMFMQRMLS
ncbi:GNAT family N-acetyltransferase [Glaciimonas sp. GNP009]